MAVRHSASCVVCAPQSLLTGKESQTTKGGDTMYGLQQLRTALRDYAPADRVEPLSNTHGLDRVSTCSSGSARSTVYCRTCGGPMHG